ncbi:MAG: OsmC family protein [Bacteroidia bacterium]|nr:OsmC family protein [Bacteroidia bacterium]
MATVVARTKRSYKTLVSNSRHELIVDEPEAKGGNDLGPTPSELLYGALASCSSITMRMYADRKEWNVQSIDVHVSNFIDGDGVEYLKKKITVSGELDDKQLKRMKTIAEKCPVHKLLANTIEIRSEIVT